MHQEALESMKSCLDKYVFGKTGSVLEVGAENVSSFKKLFNPSWNYVGIDIEDGSSVDIVLSDGYIWKEIDDDLYDVVICSSVLEHTKYPWCVVDEIARVLKPRGITVLIAPSQGPKHFHPIDAWRILPDGMKCLAEWAGLKVLEITSTTDKMWMDTVMVAQKPEGK